MNLIIKRLLKESLVLEFYGKKIIEPITKRFNDNSDDMINKLAIAFLFRQSFGDIMSFMTKQDFENSFKKWYNYNVGELIKTPDFTDNTTLAKKYLDAYIDNIVSLGNAAQPFSFKNIEKTLVDLVNTKRWIKDEAYLANTNTIYNPNSDDIAYEDDEIIILNTDTKSKCVMYGRGETWCITKADSNYYNTYRLSYGATPYFVLQKNVKGVEHKIVIMNYGRSGYAIADMSNAGERIGSRSLTMQWYKVEEELPNLNGLERYFPYREITEDERKYADLLDSVKIHFKDNDLQKLVDDSIDNLVINGARVTSGDFIRDLAANQMVFTLEQLQSLRKETLDSLIESGYFVNSYYDTKLYEDVLSQTQINRIAKLKMDNDVTISNGILEKIPEQLLKEYIRLRIIGHNNTTVGNSYTNLISEKKLDLNEIDLAYKFFPSAKLTPNRYDLEKDYEYFYAAYVDPKILNTPEGRRHLGLLKDFHIYMLLRKYPETIKYVYKLPIFQELKTWRLIDILDKTPKLLKPIVDNLTDEKKAELIENLKYTDLIALLVRDDLLVIDTPEKFDKIYYNLVKKAKGKSFVYKPELLKFFERNSNAYLYDLLVKQPTLCKYLGSEYGYVKISPYTLSDIIAKNPKTLDFIPEEIMNEMDDYNYYTAIYNNPKLAPLLAFKTSTYYIIELFKNVPKTIPQMPEEIVKRLDKYDMVDILTYNDKNKKEQYKYLEPIIDANMPQDKEFILSRI